MCRVSFRKLHECTSFHRFFSERWTDQTTSSILYHRMDKKIIAQILLVSLIFPTRPISKLEIFQPHVWRWNVDKPGELGIETS